MKPFITLFCLFALVALVFATPKEYALASQKMVLAVAASHARADAPAVVRIEPAFMGVRGTTGDMWEPVGLSWSYIVFELILAALLAGLVTNIQRRSWRVAATAGVLLAFGLVFLLAIGL